MGSVTRKNLKSLRSSKLLIGDTQPPKLLNGFRRLRPRQAGRVQLQAARVFSVVRCSADGPDSSPPGTPCDPARARAPVDALTAHSPAAAAGRTTQAGNAYAAGGAPRHHAPPARSGHSKRALEYPILSVCNRPGRFGYVYRALPRDPGLVRGRVTRTRTGPGISARICGTEHSC